MTYRLHEADPIGLAMDWLEACQRAQTAVIGELYAEAATLECECDDPVRYVGRVKILEYWRPKLAAPPPRPFRLEQIWPEARGVALVYRCREPWLIRTSFQFDVTGKIAYSYCRPELQIPLALPSESEMRRGLQGRKPTAQRRIDG